MIHYKGALVLGVLIGAAAGVLLAPEKGCITRNNLKREAKDIKDKLSKDLAEVKDVLSKTGASGRETFKKEMKDVASRASHKTDQVITFLEKQLAILKEKNKSFQTTS